MKRKKDRKKRVVYRRMKKQLDLMFKTHLLAQLVLAVSNGPCSKCIHKYEPSFSPGGVARVGDEGTELVLSNANQFEDFALGRVVKAAATADKYVLIN